MAWVKASPLHVEEYLGVALLARDLVAATDDPGLALESLLAAVRAESVNVVAFERRSPDRDAEPARSGTSSVWPRALAAHPRWTRQRRSWRSEGT